MGTTEEVFAESTSFDALGLRSSVLKGIEAAGFQQPTDIQARLIPAILGGKDVIGQAKTGTGKTASFALPILHLADADVPMQALVLVPTRELAAQVAAEIDELGQGTPIRSTCIIGGESMRDQVNNRWSKRRAHHRRHARPGHGPLRQADSSSFDNIRYVVLDEVDRMLDIGFREDIRKILKLCRQNDRQTIFVSATIRRTRSNRSRARS